MVTLSQWCWYELIVHTVIWLYGDWVGAVVLLFLSAYGKVCWISILNYLKMLMLLVPVYLFYFRNCVINFCCRSYIVYWRSMHLVTLLLHLLETLWPVVCGSCWWTSWLMTSYRSMAGQFAYSQISYGSTLHTDHLPVFVLVVCAHLNCL